MSVELKIISAKGLSREVDLGWVAEPGAAGACRPRLLVPAKVLNLLHI